MIAKAEGLAIISVIKAGFMITARGGSGIVIARLADRRKDSLLTRLKIYRLHLLKTVAFQTQTLNATSLKFLSF